MEFFKNLHIDKVFISGSMISANFGLSNSTFEIATLQRTIIKIARKTICIVPNVKFGVESFAKIVDAKDIDTVITDWEAIVYLDTSISAARSSCFMPLCFLSSSSERILSFFKDNNKIKLYQDFVESYIRLKADVITVAFALTAMADKLDLKQPY